MQSNLFLKQVVHVVTIGLKMVKIDSRKIGTSTGQSPNAGFGKCSAKHTSLIPWKIVSLRSINKVCGKADNYQQTLRFKVLTAVSMKMTAVWDIVLCSLVADRRFRAIAPIIEQIGLTNLWNQWLLLWGYTAPYYRRVSSSPSSENTLRVPCQDKRGQAGIWTHYLPNKSQNIILIYATWEFNER
jgi:hypothetical protein